MKQITRIEDLQDAITFGKEIYVVDNYINDKNEIIFNKSFKLWYIEDNTDKLHEWVKTKTLFSSEPIVLDLDVQYGIQM
jgi:hypothetical protein